MLEPFSAFAQDVEEPGVLARTVAEVARNNEMILVSGDGSPSASPMSLNTVLQFRDLGHTHVLFLSDSAASCERLRTGVPDLKCVWSSRIPKTRPQHDGICVRRFWDMRFYFYDIRKTLLYRLAVEHGVNVLQTDTDVAWLADPYPLLKTHFANHSLVVQRDAPLVNAGVIYVQNAQRGGGAAWLLQELARRVHLFLWRPDAVGEVVPWARRPFYANADEQTLMNDVLVSSIANGITYAGSTAYWEVRLGSSKHVKWEQTAEKRRYDALMRSASQRRRAMGRTRAADAALQQALCERPHGRNDFGAWYPLHEVGGADRVASSYAAAPNWLFAHYPADAGAWFASGHSAAEPGLCVPHAQAPPAGLLQQAEQVAAYGPPARVRPDKPPYVMLHMAGVRTGAWHRRALLRAHGWWHPEADQLMATDTGWARRGVLRVASPLPALRPQQLDVLVSNLVLLALLSGRSAVVPDMLCPAAASAEGKAWKAEAEFPPRLARIHQGGVGSLLPAERCSWVPPVHDPCLKLQYVTAAEHAATPPPAANPQAAAEAVRCAAAAAAAAATDAAAAASPPGTGTALLPEAAPLHGVAAAGEGGAPLVALLRALECYASLPDVALAPSLLEPLGAHLSALAEQPLIRQPSHALQGVGASAQDVSDGRCLQYLVDRAAS